MLKLEPCIVDALNLGLNLAWKIQNLVETFIINGGFSIQLCDGEIEREGYISGHTKNLSR